MARETDHSAGPTRACAACRQRRPAAELIRLAAEGDRVVPDLRRRAGGRGVHLCPTRGCLALALKKRVLGRVLRRPVHVQPEALAAALVEALDGALRALLTDARRSGAVVDATPDGVRPPALAAWRERAARAGRPLPPVAVVDEAKSARVAWLCAALSEFTLDRPGDMNPRPATGGQDGPVAGSRARRNGLV